MLEQPSNFQFCLRLLTVILALVFAAAVIRSCVTPQMTRPGMMFSTFWSDTAPNGYYKLGENYKDMIRYELMWVIMLVCTDCMSYTPNTGRERNNQEEIAPINSLIESWKKLEEKQCSNWYSCTFWRCWLLYDNHRKYDNFITFFLIVTFSWWMVYFIVTCLLNSCNSSASLEVRACTVTL